VARRDQRLQLGADVFSGEKFLVAVISNGGRLRADALGLDIAKAFLGDEGEPLERALLTLSPHPPIV